MLLLLRRKVCRNMGRVIRLLLLLVVRMLLLMMMIERLLLMSITIENYRRHWRSLVYNLVNDGRCVRDGDGVLGRRFCCCYRRRWQWLIMVVVVVMVLVVLVLLLLLLLLKSPISLGRVLCRHRRLRGLFNHRHGHLMLLLLMLLQQWLRLLLLVVL